MKKIYLALKKLIRVLTRKTKGISALLAFRVVVHSFFHVMHLKLFDVMLSFHVSNYAYFQHYKVQIHE